MKASVLALVLLCATSATVAQLPPPPPGASAFEAHQLERLTLLLDLTDAQQTQVKSILEAGHAKMKAQFEAARASGTRPSFEQMRAAHEQIRAEMLQQLTPVLSALQLKKFQVLMEDEHRFPGGPHDQRPHGPPPPDGVPPPASPN